MVGMKDSTLDLIRAFRWFDTNVLTGSADYSTAEVRRRYSTVYRKDRKRSDYNPKEFRDRLRKGMNELSQLREVIDE
jgi:hypothetical protein